MVQALARRGRGATSCSGFVVSSILPSSSAHARGGRRYNETCSSGTMDGHRTRRRVNRTACAFWSRARLYGSFRSSRSRCSSRHALRRSMTHGASTSRPRDKFIRDFAAVPFQPRSRPTQPPFWQRSRPTRRSRRLHQRRATVSTSTASHVQRRQIRVTSASTLRSAAQGRCNGPRSCLQFQGKPAHRRMLLPLDDETTSKCPQGQAAAVAGADRAAEVVG